MIITIDGSAGTGKTTVARNLAERLHITFFETGAMYRSLAWYLLHQKIDIYDEPSIEKVIKNFKFDIQTDAHGHKRYFVLTEDVTHAIKTPHISKASSIISAFAPVRKHLLNFQRDFAHRHDTVFEGRDLGTVVFPSADFKVFLYAAPEIRAERRLKELHEKHPDKKHEMSYEEILKDINERDHRDSTRTLAPLRCPEGALEIDTSHLTIDDIIEKILSYITPL